MKNYLLLYAVVVTALLFFGYRRYRSETHRLVQNQRALAADVAHYRTRLGEQAASVQVLRLRCSEFEELRAADAARIRQLGVKLRRLEAAAHAVTRTEAEFRAPLCGSSPGDGPVRAGGVSDTLRDTLGDRAPGRTDTLVARFGPLLGDDGRFFRWRDPWVRVEGVVRGDSVVCRIESTDTLRQVVHRVPHRFLFIRWGTKALRQQIVSSNPHTRIVYSEYVKIER